MCKKSLLTHRRCPHCGKVLNIKTFKEHRRLYYDDATKLWTTNEDLFLPTTRSASNNAEPCSGAASITPMESVSRDLDENSDELSESDLDLGSISDADAEQPPSRSQSTLRSVNMDEGSESGLC